MRITLLVGEVIRARPFGMFEFVAALAVVAAISIGVSKGYHKEGGGGMIAFLLMYGIAFVVIGAIFALVALLAG